MRNTKFKTDNFKSLSFILPNGRADGFRHNFYKVRDFLNHTQALHGYFKEPDGATLYRPLTVEEMRKTIPEDELPVCNVSVRQTKEGAVATFTSPAKATDRFLGDGKPFLDSDLILGIWRSFNNGWAHSTELRAIVG